MVAQADGESSSRTTSLYRAVVPVMCPEAKEVQRMARGFRELLRERQPEALDRWLEAAKGSKAAELKDLLRLSSNSGLR